MSALIAVTADGQDWTESVLRKPPFRGWKTREVGINGFAIQDNHRFVMVSGHVIDGKRWVHLSMSRRDRIPTWDELVELRDLVLGEEAQCIQLLPPRTRHVNIHPRCLHLWHTPDGDGIPDFTMGTGMI